MIIARVLLCAFLLAGTLISQGWGENARKPADSSAASGPRYFNTQDGFQLNVQHIKRRSGTVTAMVTLVTKEEFAVCSNEIAMDGRAGDSTLEISIKGIYHPVPFFMDTRGPATGAYYLDSPPERYQLRIAYRDAVDIWQVQAHESGVELQPVNVSFTESNPIWPHGKKPAAGGK